MFIVSFANCHHGMSILDFNMIQPRFMILQEISKMFMIAQFNGCSVMILLLMERLRLIAALARQVLSTIMALLTFMSSYMKLHQELTDTACLTVTGLIKKTRTQGTNASVL